jgi:hypothetical protein
LKQRRAEIERRRAAKLEAAGPDARTRLFAELEAMAERLRMAPDFREPTAVENAEEIRPWLQSRV